MISIENANMELAIADLFASILHVRRPTGRVIYLTPKSALARLEIFKNAVSVELTPKGDPTQREKMQSICNRALGVADRARAAVGRRHGIIHDIWGIDDETDAVVRKSLVLEAKTDGPVKIETLNELISSMRSIIDNARQLTQELRDHPAQMVNLALPT